MPPKPSIENPYIPDQGVIGDLPAGSDHMDRAAVIANARSGAHRAWVWPVAGLLLWLAVGRFYDSLAFWLFEVPGFNPPSRDSIMGGVVTISAVMWLMGCWQQILLLARFRQVPGVRIHLIAGVLASGVGVFVALNSLSSTKSSIIEYGGDRGPVPEPVPQVVL